MATSPSALNGGIPNVPVDVPITSVFVALFVGLAASHMTLYQLNLRRGHKFLFNALIFGFCMSRIGACVMRIVWATRPKDGNVAIAAQVFINAGILLIYVINNLLVQRLLRAAVPRLGWNKYFRVGYKVILYLLIPVILMVIVTVPQSFKTNDLNTKRIDRYIQLASLTYITVIAVLPLIWLPVAVFYARKQPIDHFGDGSWTAKVCVLATTTVLACIEAGFKVGTAWEAPRPATNPAWYHSKAAFYCFGFMIDVLLVVVFLAGRVDIRLHVPNGSNGSYAARREELAAAAAAEKEGAESGEGEEELKHTL